MGSSPSTLPIGTAGEVPANFLRESMEQWRPISDLPGYSISNKGRVRRDSDGHIMKLGTNNGYQRIVVAKHVHRLVAEAFLPEPEDGTKRWVDHIDGNRSNNNAENLRWVTPSENCLAFGYENRIQNKKRPVKAINTVTGEVLEFDSRQAAAEYFHCNDSQISYGYVYKKGRKRNWYFEKLKR